jgi:hypothetical protein
MQGNSEREGETHLLTDRNIKYLQQDDKSDCIHQVHIATVIQQHRPIQLVDKKKCK